MTGEPMATEGRAGRTRDAERVAAIEAALARSALFEALALGFSPPSEAAGERLTGAGGAAGLADAAEAAGYPDLDGLVRELAARDARRETLEATYGRLFGHTARGEAPPYETEYGAGDTFRQPQELADVAGFYRAFGLRMSPSAAERPDHAACECEFASFLARREALAIESGDDDGHEIVVRAERLFLRDHLARFLPAMAGRLQRADRHGFYGALGAVAEALARAECRRLKVDAGPASLPLRSAEEDAVPMACASCPAPGALDPTELD